MTSAVSLFTTGISTIFSVGAWILVLWKLNPSENPALSLPLFFLTLFFASVSLLTCIGLFIRRSWYKNFPPYNSLTVSFRQAVELTFCIIGSLFFLMLGVLTWWNGLLLGAIVLLAEWYFSARENL
ncbi:hypothetical protein HZA41_02525 [Candidatus Peregrinibacteria bacterium]|nr:hypothetical protein [Candidatus Peregrinibacteria bacterium]